MFSKPPIGQLSIRVFDPQGDVVASGEFNQDRTQLYRLSLRRAREFAAGRYKIEYRVDNQVLLSEPTNLSQ
jgi:methionine-rich copper-binding protein CopC